MMEKRRQQAAHYAKMIKTGVPSHKAKEYFIVRKIIKHHIQPDNEILFYVNWEGFSEQQNSWEPEKNMDGAIDLVNEYRLKHNLPPTTLKKFAGAVEPNTEHRNNWVTPNTVLEKLNSFSKHERFRSNIRIKEYTASDQLDDMDTLYITIIDFHMFTILHQPSKGQVLVADGSNSYIMNEESRKGIQELLRTDKIQSILFEGQEGVDQCGSSAIAIGLEFIRLYKTGEEIGEKMEVCKYYLNKAKKMLHKEPTTDKLTNRKSNMLKRPQLRCDECEWSTISTKRNGLSMHKRQAHKK